MAHKFPFEKLDVWHLAKNFSIAVYKTVNDFPVKEKYNLSSQLTRASVSVASNIAEGSSRTSFRDQSHFSQLAYSSLMETANQLIIANELGFIKESTYLELRVKIEAISNKLNALRKYQLAKSRKP